MSKDELLRELASARERIAALEASNEEARRRENTDVAPHERFEAARRESEELLQVASEHLNGILWAVDTDLRMILMKGRGLAALGLHAGQAVGAPL